jgi:hypothetical protein
VLVGDPDPIGAHTKAVAESRENFAKLAVELLIRCNIPQRVPESF